MNDYRLAISNELPINNARLSYIANRKWLMHGESVMANCACPECA